MQTRMSVSVTTCRSDELHDLRIKPEQEGINGRKTHGIEKEKT